MRSARTESAVHIPVDMAFVLRLLVLSVLTMTPPPVDKNPVDILARGIDVLVYKNSAVDVISACVVLNMPVFTIKESTTILFAFKLLVCVFPL